MSLQARHNTRPEVALRQLLHRMGFRYRVDQPIASFPRRRVDVVFPAAKVAVFVDGCFWHCCPTHGTCPKTNSEWWAQKLRANVVRDRETNRLLAESGWTVVRVWEHEDASAAARRVAATLACRRDRGMPPVPGPHIRRR
jgi:DNA mismatch endonuclease (patch repair protein)